MTEGTLCTVCARRPRRERRKLCVECAAALAVYRAAFVARAHAKGLCPECGGPLGDTRPVCRTCRDDRNAAHTELRRARVCAGLCPECGDPATRGVLCDWHYQTQTAKKLRTGARPSFCRCCRTWGHHYAKTCPQRRT